MELEVAQILENCRQNKRVTVDVSCESGRLYDMGEYYYKNKSYDKAADQGNATAMNNLAVAYSSGQGMEKDKEQAFLYFKKAAENNDIYAMYSLGNIYERGEEVEQNLEQALYWYQKAAEQDYAPAKKIYEIMSGITSKLQIKVDETDF